MFRSLRVGRAPAAILTLSLLVLAAKEARAQYGYGYYPAGYGGYGWGGWSSTGEGDIARGLGYYNIGAGVYNLNTAQAASINTDTVIRWNQYLYASALEAARRDRALRARRIQRTATTGEAIYERLRDKPTPADITSGDALNVILDQVSDPRVQSSSIRMATAKIPGEVVRTIPFVNASEAVSISLDRLTSDESWPPALRGPAFELERKAYSEAVDRALKEDEEGEISAASIKSLRDILGRIRIKLEASPPTDKPRLGEAQNYLKTLYGMTRMLEKPEVGKIIAELEKVKETSLGSLLGFMHTFNLRFGKPTTPAQRATYERLYPIMVAYRDRVVPKDLKPDTKASPKAKSDLPTDFFQGMHLDRIEGKTTDGSPPPDKK
jgi:hypothetical protein